MFALTPLLVGTMISCFSAEPPDGAQTVGNSPTIIDGATINPDGRNRSGKDRPSSVEVLRHDSLPCDSVADSACQDSEYCKLGVGVCSFADAYGYCMPKPQWCPDIVHPVCGCDGLSYANACNAASAGVSVAHFGPCLPDCCDPATEPGANGDPACVEGVMCCANGSWQCNNGDGTSACDAEGIICPDLCDGFTSPGCAQYGCPDGYACDTSIGCTPSYCVCDPDTGQILCTTDCGGGMCVPIDPPCCDPALEPGTDGLALCIEGATCCGDGSWQCNGANGAPTCIVMGDVCPNLCEGFEPPGCVQTGCPDWMKCDTAVGCVPSSCSCDPATGQIICTDDCGGGMCVPIGPPPCCDPSLEPGTNGLPFCFEGATCCLDGKWRCNEGDGTPSCNALGDVCNEVCGGIAGIECGDGEFCDLGVGQCCCDFEGKCVPIPDACPQIYMPVCGCDGITYGNKCEAHASGTSIAHLGACEVDCRPADDGFGCAINACSPIPEDQCLGTILHLEVTSGAVTTLACECIDANACHVVFGDASPFPAGSCPPGHACEVFSADSDGDGIDDVFTAACIPDFVGACCIDISGSPLPFLACQETSPAACENATGTFHGIDSTCDAMQACCLSNPAGSACWDINPLCCLDLGGVPQGPNSKCTSLAPDGVCLQPCDGLGPMPPCPDGQYCQHPTGECQDGIPGVCEPQPQACPAIVAPVCGCDGTTYANPCEAAAAGVNIAHEGLCDPVLFGTCCLDISDGPIAYETCIPLDQLSCVTEGGVFSGGPNFACDDTQACCVAGFGTGGFCGDLNPKCCIASGGVPQGPGSACIAISPNGGGVCQQNNCCDPTLEPGANGNPFCIEGATCCGNGSWMCNNADGSPACELGGVGQVCDQVCGGIAGIPCGDGEFCQLGVGNCCCDFQGVCVPKPANGCPEYYSPVCGCDGTTYGNPCEAAAAGVSIDHVGPCEDPCCDPALEPGTNGNPICFEGSTCCANGQWACNNGAAQSTCGPIGPGPVCEVPCCDPALQPGTNGNPLCFEGATCCASGNWTCNNGDGTPACNALGVVCPNLCEGFTPPGCVQSGCPAGKTCDVTVGCVPSFCVCDPLTGQIVCTADCGGGTCVPVEPPCCDPALEPGVNGNPLCFEGSTCCANGLWACNNGAAQSTCGPIGPGPVCEVPCCDPALEPGTNGNPLCFEGSTCCANGTWQCNNGDATPSCNALGIVCPNLCEGFTPPGCVQSGCPAGKTCDVTVGCVPSFCVCDPLTGQIICTDDCGGGTCVPIEPPCCDPALEPGTNGNPLCFEGATCCASGNWTCNNGAGVPTCGPIGPGPVCEVPCCDPALQPGTNGIPLCFEGATCCASGNWTCNNGDGTAACNALGIVCPNLCDGFTPPGCVQSGCPNGNTCDVTVGCVPSACSCDPATGQIVCTADCGGGTCVPIEPSCCDPALEPGANGTPLCIEGATCCADGQWTCNTGAGLAACGPIGPGPVCVEICGGFAGIQCQDPADYCNLGVGQCCCDFQGVCTPKPIACPIVGNPVCGCNGMTYTSACKAAAAGVSINHDGACAN